VGLLWLGYARKNGLQTRLATMTELLNHRYRILQTIGDGGFGQTSGNPNLRRNQFTLLKNFQLICCQT
jgi:hypothetical protein